MGIVSARPGLMWLVIQPKKGVEKSLLASVMS
jgi:hypothetical protein